MIKNDKEYNVTIDRLKEMDTLIETTKMNLSKEGYGSDEIQKAIDPMETFRLQYKEEIEFYDAFRNHDIEFEALINLEGIGQLLISLRIYKNMTQVDLANKLGVAASQVCRDEKNEYHGISNIRVRKILKALGVELHSKVIFNGKAA